MVSVIGVFRGLAAIAQFGPCDAVTRPWSADVIGDGKFAGGKAATMAIAIAIAFAGDGISCGEGYAEATVQLSRSRK